MVNDNEMNYQENSANNIKYAEKNRKKMKEE
jgi:hypothetical protein